MKIVLDTNVYIAAALHDGFSAHIVEILTENPIFTIIISEEILIELNQKLKNKFNWLQEDINRYLTGIEKIAELVKIGEKIEIITRDVKDNRILECALVPHQFNYHVV